MIHKEAQKLIQQIILSIKDKGIIPDTIIDNLAKIRVFAVEEKRPVVAKSLRLIVEHITDNQSFIIPIPNDDPLDENSSNQSEMITGDESLIYLLHLISKSSNKLNLLEIREYNRLMQL